MELTDFQKKLVTLLPEMNFAMEEPMAKHTSFRIGGPVEVMAFPKNADELRKLFEQSDSIEEQIEVLNKKSFTVKNGAAGCDDCSGG